MRVVVPCRFPEEQARARVEKCLNGLKEKYADRVGDILIDWHGSSAGVSFLLLKPFPLRIAAELTVKRDEIVCGGDPPIVAWPFRAQIEALIGDRLRASLA
jgi:hypothetical protein